MSKGMPPLTLMSFGVLLGAYCVRWKGEKGEAMHERCWTAKRKCTHVQAASLALVAHVPAPKQKRAALLGCMPSAYAQVRAC